jgi:hypothetical protein
MSLTYKDGQRRVRQRFLESTHIRPDCFLEGLTQALGQQCSGHWPSHFLILRWPSSVSGGGGGIPRHVVCGAGPPPIEPLWLYPDKFETPSWRVSRNKDVLFSDCVSNFLTGRGSIHRCTLGRACPTELGQLIASRCLAPISPWVTSRILHLKQSPSPRYPIFLLISSIHFTLTPYSITSLDPINPSPQTQPWSAMSHQCKASATTWKT